MDNSISIDYDFNHLSCSTEAPDVILIVEETEIPAHRSVLSERCEYFRAMFASSFIEAKSDRILLKETKLTAFKVILKFIYTGEFSTLYHECRVAKCDDTHVITLDQLFEILQCARYYMLDELVNDTISRLKLKWSYNTTGLLLNNALAYSVDELIPYSTELIQKNAYNLVENKVFEQLSLTALEHILKQQLDTYESNIFEALVNWMRTNPDYSEIFPKLLEKIELNLLDKAHLDMLLKPTQLIDPLFFKNLLNQQREQAQNVQKVVDQNVINANDLRIIDGTKNRIYVRRNIGEATVTPLLPKGSIVFDLKQQFILNCLIIDFVGNSFTVSVSKDTCDWESVIAFSKYKCKVPQILYFTERAVRFIRIQSNDDYLNISTNIEAMYSTGASSIEIDPDTAFIVPNYNVMPSELSVLPPTNGHIVGTWTGGKVKKGRIKQYVNSGIIYQFRYPYVVETLKLLFKKETSYYVEIAYTKQEWTRVNSEENVTGWRLATFKRQPVMFIKVVGTKAHSSHFYLHNIRCPAIELPNLL